MAFQWVPEITYSVCEVPTTLTLTLPQRLWALWSEGQGGQDESAAGIQESFQLRRDRGRRVTIRLWESEWPGVELWLSAVQLEPQAFTFQFDKDLPATAYSVRLVTPLVGQRIAPQRDPFNGLLTLTVEIRTADGAEFNLPFYDTTLMTI